MEIGVTCVNPETTDFPSCAQKLSNGTWVCVVFIYYENIRVILTLFESIEEISFVPRVDMVWCRYTEGWSMHFGMLRWQFRCAERR